jgi:phenylalanyl-tRNA synthetase beta chain
MVHVQVAFSPSITKRLHSMPVITLDYNDLEKLTGADRKTIVSRIPMIGADVERLEDDHVDIEFFPSRPDLYSVEGAARAMRGFLGIEKGLCEYEVRPYSVEIYKDAAIDDVRPVLGCAVVRGMKFTSSSIKSLMDLQEDLHWAIGRNRKKVSIGVHDMAHIKPPFNTRQWILTSALCLWISLNLCP